MKFLNLIFAVTVLLLACQQQPSPPKDAASAVPAFLRHKYWVGKAYKDALFAPNVIDTLAFLPCEELVFTQKDSLLFTACLSDAGRGLWRMTGTNTLVAHFEGDTTPCSIQYNEATGVLTLKTNFGAPATYEFVAYDNLSMADPYNGVVQMGRKRLAGAYAQLPQKGTAATMLELREDGSLAGLGDFDQYEPWTSGTGGVFIADRKNLMYLTKKGDVDHQVAVAWQLHGDTLRLWETKNMNPDELPEYKIIRLKGAYVKK